MIQGISIHESLEYGYGSKLKTGMDPKVDSMLEKYEDSLNREMEECEDEDRKKKPEFLDKGVRMIRYYRDSHMPKVIPVEVEKSFAVDMGDYEYTGRIDLIDSKGVVIDHKTTSRTPSENLMLKKDQQTAGYAMATGKKKVRLDFLVQTSTPKIVSFQVTKKPSDVERLKTNIALVRRAIEAKLFYCIHGPTEWTCTDDWCAYQRYGYHDEHYKLGTEGFIEKYKKEKPASRDEEEQVW